MDNEREEKLQKLKEEIERIQNWMQKFKRTDSNPNLSSSETLRAKDEMLRKAIEERDIGVLRWLEYDLLYKYINQPEVKKIEELNQIVNLLRTNALFKLKAKLESGFAWSKKDEDSVKNYFYAIVTLHKLLYGTKQLNVNIDVDAKQVLELFEKVKNKKLRKKIHTDEGDIEIIDIENGNSEINKIPPSEN